MDFRLEDHLLPCFFKSNFGVDCPGCGLQRSILSLFKGDFGAAFELYPPVYSLGLLLASTGFLLVKKNRFAKNTAIASGILHGVAVLASYLHKII